jgi:DNA ligase 1
MRRFAALYLALDATASLKRKQSLLVAYFQATPPEDAAWGLWLLLGNRLKRTVGAVQLRAAVTRLSGLPPEVVEASYAQVGDLAETLALLTDDGRPRTSTERGLAEWIAELQRLAGAPEGAAEALLERVWTTLPFAEAYLFNKLLTGALRVGVSRGLAARALAEAAGLSEAVVARRLAGDWRPSAAALLALQAPQTASVDPAQPYPFALASPLDDAPETLGAATDHAAEWKWDGIRAQLLRRGGEVHLWSRGEELLDGRFPEIETAAQALPDGCVLDGEVLAWNADGVMPFAVLQRRIGRKRPGPKSLRESPVRFLAYDLLEVNGEDQRERPFQDRRAALETLLRAVPDLLLSPLLATTDWAGLAAAREAARERGTEGLMLKRWDAPYPLGRRRGAWWKWKLNPRHLDAVLLYAQAGHGRRANLYTDYTLGVWDGGTLVPVTKAYSGLTDEELTEMDRWIRRHTVERFGPVRSVAPEQVFEIAFEGIQESPRHKSGIALRFPRIARWRKDKTAAQADTLESLKAMLRA